MILLDSSILIELFRRKDKENTEFYRISSTHKDLFISSITYYEIGIGNRKSHMAYWEELCNNLIVLPFDSICADKAISIYLNLLRANQMIDLADILIGATALTHSMPIVTLNDKHFARIEGLEILKSPE